MATAITAQKVADRISRALAVAKPSGGDGFLAGSPDEAISGIATTFVPSLAVLKQAAAAGKNLIVCRESPFWNRGAQAQALAGEAVFEEKREFLRRNRMVVYRLRAAWDAQTPDPQVLGLKKALGWERESGSWFAIPKTKLRLLVAEIAKRLNGKAARVLGDPEATVAKVALSHGVLSTPQLATLLRESGADAVIAGEPVEWEASTYFQDVIASGQKRGLIVLGLAASEEPGCAAMAAWLKPMVTEVDVEFIRAGEPFHAAKWAAR